MKLKEKIIKRLNKGFGYNIPNDTPYCHHQATFCGDGRFSWSIACGVHDIGSTSSMKECLSWKRWVLNTELHEIFEYYDNMKLTYSDVLEDVTINN